MPAETSIPCSKEARDLVAEYMDRTDRSYDSYDEVLRDVFSEQARTRS